MNRYDLKASPSAAKAEREREIDRHFDGLALVEKRILAVGKTFPNHQATANLLLDSSSFAYSRVSNWVYVRFNVIDMFIPSTAFYPVYIRVQDCDDDKFIFACIRDEVQKAKEKAQRPKAYDRALQSLSEDYETHVKTLSSVQG